MENIIFCGLGKVGKVICEDFLKRKDIKVCNKFISLEKNNIKIKNKTFYPISLNELKKIKKDFIIIDFTLPTCVNENINFYLKNNINFVCGTTGVDFNNLNKKIKKSKSVCVVAPNMGKEIVVFYVNV